MPVPDIVDRIRTSLALSEPDLDTTIGTPVRKIIEAFAEVIAEGELDSRLLDYQYDIDAKSGPALDDMLALFGFYRHPPRRATGTIIFERQTPAEQDISIAPGTQVATLDSPAVIFYTVVPAVLNVGSTVIEVPVQAVTGGTSGNVPAGAVRRWINPIGGINSMSNPMAFTGGTEAETDEQFRTRFRRTVFRNMAGTEHMFLGVALEDVDVSQANVIGASKRRREQIELVGGNAVSTVQDAKYVYDGTSVFGVDIEGGDVLTPGLHYGFNPTIPPSISSLDATIVPDGVYELEYEYLPAASRNDPTTGITNRVDVYVNGQRPVEAAETTVFNATSVFKNLPGDPLDVTRFERLDGTQPTVGNVFIPLTMVPVIDPTISNEIVIGTDHYVEGEDYFLVNDITNEGGTWQSRSGIEWVTQGSPNPAPPANGTVLDVAYTFNAIPRDVETAIRMWKLVTTDVRVHQARQILLNMYFAVIPNPGYTVDVIKADVFSRIAAYLSDIGFGQPIQVSDILQVAHDSPGVDSVRFLNSGDDPADFGIKRMSRGGTVLGSYDDGGTPARPVDVLLADDEVTALNDISIVLKAQNTYFGGV